jgi:hypothetical protein
VNISLPFTSQADAASEALLHAASVGNAKEMHMLVLEGFAYFKVHYSLPQR